MIALPAWCVMRPVGPTFYNTGCLTSLSYCRPPAPALTDGGRWEQRRLGAATHLPVGAGHNRTHTAKAGMARGAFAPLVFIWYFTQKIVNFFHNYYKLQDFSCKYRKNRL